MIKVYFKSTSIFFILFSFQLSAQTYISYFVGDTNDVQTTHEWGVCLMGGATENDSAMVWFLKKANGGDVLVLRASGADGYNNYMYSQLGVNLNSVQTLVISSVSAANNAYVINQILNAEAIFIAGGNQADYVNYWKNTALDTALNYYVQVKKGVIGGTSAGMAILGEYYFSALNGTVSSNTALSQPFNSAITIGVSDFIKHPILKNIITDTHYDNPDRRGRHTVFLSRIQHLGKDTVYGIACDEYTAVCIDSNKIARVYGDYPNYDDNAYFIQINCETPNTPEILTSSSPLTWMRNNKALKVCRIKGTPQANNSFNLNDWKTQIGGEWLHWYINNGTLTSENGSQPDCTPTGILNYNTTELNVFPNPARDKIFISIPIENIKKMLLTDISGKDIVCLNSNELDISSFPRGIYLLTIYSTEEIIFSKKIIKN